MQKAGLQPTEGKSPDHIPVNETVIQVDAQRYWLYAAADPVTNEFLHAKLGTMQNLGLSKIFFWELRERQDISDNGFLVDGAPWVEETFRRYGFRFQHETRESEHHRTSL